MQVAVFGAGAWGSALAQILATNGHNVRLWSHSSAQVESILASQQVSYLPNIDLSPLIVATDSIATAMDGVDAMLVAVPSHAFRETLSKIKPFYQQQPVAWATKGFEQGSYKLLHQVVLEELGEDGVVISGPTFATEVARLMPTAVVAAGSPEQSEVWVRLMNSKAFRVYTNDDIAGVELGGALKNVIAIAAGISDGLGFGANARAALVTRGLAEMARLAVVLGGKPETMMGLAGMGDLVLTCTDNQSRNRRFGLALAEGGSVEEVVAEIGQVVEGAKAASLALELARENGVDMPIVEQVARVLSDEIKPHQAVVELMSREPGSE